MPLLKQFLHRKFNGISRSAFRRGFNGFERRSKKHIAKIRGFHEGKLSSLSNCIRISYEMFVENSNEIRKTRVLSIRIADYFFLKFRKHIFLSRSVNYENRIRPIFTLILISIYMDGNNANALSGMNVENLSKFCRKFGGNLAEYSTRTSARKSVQKLAQILMLNLRVNLHENHSFFSWCRPHFRPHFSPGVSLHFSSQFSLHFDLHFPMKQLPI